MSAISIVGVRQVYSEMKRRLMQIRDLIESLEVHLKLSDEHEH